MFTHKNSINPHNKPESLPFKDNEMVNQSSLVIYLGSQREYKAEGGTPSKPSDSKAWVPSSLVPKVIGRVVLSTFVL